MGRTRLLASDEHLHLYARAALVSCEVPRVTNDMAVCAFVAGEDDSCQDCSDNRRRGVTVLSYNASAAMFAPMPRYSGQSDQPLITEYQS